VDRDGQKKETDGKKEPNISTKCNQKPRQAKVKDSHADVAFHQPQVIVVEYFGIPFAHVVFLRCPTPGNNRQVDCIAP
jgi:hypothetical protein